MSEQPFSHLDAAGTARMVDTGRKPIQRRTAIAGGFIVLAPSTVTALRAHALPKGDVLTVARIAAIQAAKRTDSLIPLCHSLPLDAVDLDFSVQENGVAIQATAITTAKTGVEMEALTAVSIAALTIYDMCKAVDKNMVIQDIRLLSKTKE
ncbi:MAG: moaC [Verrucomicrobiales bacterium]|nr:moaC [Verrucomicrobiales bacterium]